MKQHLPITLERYAALQARLDRGDRLADVVASEGLSMDAWRATQEGWLSLMATEAMHKRSVLSRRYQEAYFAERPELVAAPVEKASDLDGTALGVHLDLAASLPFAAADGTPPPKRPAIADDALPFGRKPPRAEPPKIDPPRVEPPGVEPPRARAPEIHAPPSSVDETVMVGELKLDLDEAVPFRGERPAPPPSAAKDLTPLPAGDLDGTSTMNPALALESTLPFESSKLTLEQYASLCAECEVTPEATASIEQKYGLSSGDRARLDATWQKRLARDAAASARFHDLLAQYTRWLKRRA